MTDVQNVLITATVALIPVLAGFLIQFFKNKTAELKQRMGKSEFYKYVDIAENAVLTAVSAVSQTYVDTLKKGGTFGPQEQTEAFNKAKSQAISIMGEAARDTLENAYIDFDAWLNGKIEAAVKAYK